MKLLLRKKLKNDKRKKTVMFGISMSSSPSRGTEFIEKEGEDYYIWYSFVLYRVH